MSNSKLPPIDSLISLLLQRVGVRRESVDLIKLAVPVIGAMLLQMTYNLTDMVWVGKIGSNAVASIGTAGFFLAIGWALVNFITVGTGIRISHSVGSKEGESIHKYALNGLVYTVILALIFASTIFTFAKNLIMFFNIENVDVNINAISYLKISAFGSLFTLISLVLVAILNGLGKTKDSFKGGLIGTIINIVLDPLLIFYFDLGIDGAAYATVISKSISLTYLLYLVIGRKYIKLKLSYLSKESLKEVLKLGAPAALQRLSFMIIYIVLGRIITEWGPTAIAVQKIGIQIESFTFMFVGGLSQAISISVGQNFGAGNYRRIQQIYSSGMKFGLVIGAITTLLFLIIPEQLFSIFVSEPESIVMGANYLRILAVSQIFMCAEMMSNGAYSGCGKTNIPAIISITFTSLRIPLAYSLGCCSILQLSGVWWSISITSIIKGVILSTLFFLFITKKVGAKNKI